MNSERGLIGLGVVALAAVVIFVVLRGCDVDPRLHSALRTQAARPGKSQQLAPSLLTSAESGRTTIVAAEVAPPCDAPGRRITIAVVESAGGRPLEHASVELLRGAERVQLLADSEGVIVVGAEQLVDTGLVARAPGHFLAGLGPDAVQASTRFSDRIDVQLAPSGALGVWLVDDASGAPIANARIAVHVADPVTGARAASQPFLWPHFVGANRLVSALVSDTYVPAFTDENGWCWIASLPTGTPLRVSADEAVEPCGGVVTIAAGEAEAEIKLVGRTGCRVMGRVLKFDGTPLADAGVRASGRVAGGTYDRYARTAEDGSFVLTGTARGENALELEGVEAPALAFACDGGAHELGDIRLGELGELAGNVTFGSAARAGATLPAIALRVVREGRCVTEVRPGTDGRFRALLAHGPCRIVVSSGAHASAVVEADVPTHDLQLDASRWFGGIRLAGFDAAYDPGFELRLRQRAGASGDSGLVVVRAGPGQFAYVEGDDWIAWPVAPGRYEAAMRPTRDGDWLDLGTIDVRAGEECAVSATDAANCAGGLDVIVADAQGRAVDGLEVVCALAVSESRDEAGTRRLATTGADGRVAFQDLQCGAWIVAPASLGISAPDARRVTVSPSSSAAVALESAAPASVGVQVTASGAALPGARVTVRPRTEMYGQASARTLLSDAAGRALFSSLAPGEYAVACVFGKADRVYSQSQFVQLSGGTAGELKFDVECAGARIVVRDDASVLGDVASANFLSTTGVCKGRVDPDSGAIEACPEPGAWIALLTRSSDHASFHSSRPTGMTIATLDVPPSRTDGELIAEVGRGSVSVRIEAQARAPRVQIVSARGVSLQLAPGEFPPLAAASTSEDEFVVAGLPVPCRLRFSGETCASGTRASFDVDVVSADRVALAWPPRR